MKYFDKIVYITFVVIWIVGGYLYYTYVYNYSGHVDVELIGVYKNPSDSLNRELIERDSIRITYLIDNMDMLNFTIDDLSLNKKKEKIKHLINLKLYDYYISVGRRVFQCDYSAYFTEHGDGICKEVDSRIPLDVKFSSYMTDSIYIYINY